MKKVRIALASTAIALVCPTVAGAQSASQGADASASAGDPASADATSTGQDIVVTAQRRSENLSRVPQQISAFSGADLGARGVTSTADLQSIVPGLAIQATNRETVVAIRGIGNNVRAISADPSTATYLDGVYLSRSNMVLGALYDVQRVEVLKGPQGTLYGRNATSGVINIISQEPTDGLHGKLRLGGGSYGLMTAEGALNLPISEGSGFRIAGYYAQDDGFTKNVATGHKEDQTNIRSVRGSLKLELSPALTFKSTVEYTDDKGTVGYGYSAEPYPVGVGLPKTKFAAPQFDRIDARNIRLDYPTVSRRQSFVGSAQLAYDMGPATLRATYGHTDYRAHDGQDIDLSSDPSIGHFQLTRVKSKADSLEFQVSNNGQSRLGYTGGLFLYQENAHEFIFLNQDGIISLDTEARNRSLGAFAELSYKITDTITVLGGYRYTTEDKRANTVAVVLPSGAGKVSFSASTPRVRVTWAPTSTFLVYANYARGFKSGGLNSQQANNSFLPETIDDFDAGFKASLLDRRLFLDGSVFHYNYKNLQLRNAVVSGTQTLVTINNAGNAKITGAELQGRLRLPSGFTLDGSATYLDTKLHDFTNRQGVNYDGQPLPLAPRWAYTIGGQYEGSIGDAGLRLRAEYDYRSSFLFASNLRDYRTERTDGYGLLSLSARLTLKEHMYFEVLGRNVTNKLYAANRGDFRGEPGLETNYGAPRTIEARVGFDF